jgi:RNA polymerase sigma-70 factor, ECF subfamily
MVPAGPPDTATALVDRLYAQHGQALVAYAASLLGDRQLAEDIVQETMIKAWRLAEQLLRRDGSLRSWLFRVTHNLVVDRVRARRARPAEVAEFPEAQATEPDPADEVVATVALRQAFAVLPAGQRDVLEQVYLHGHTALETAALLGIPVGTVKSRLYHALRALRPRMARAAEAA